MRFALALLIFTVTLSGADYSKRVLEIEQRFSVVFVKEDNISVADSTLPVWEFFELKGPIGFVVPVNATDGQIRWAKAAAEFSVGFYWGWQKLQQQQAKPTPTPSLL